MATTATIEHHTRARVGRGRRRCQKHALGRAATGPEPRRGYIDVFPQVTSGNRPSGSPASVGVVCSYDPTTGTFLSPDPIDGADGTPTVANEYHYVGNDPLNFTDPLGLCRTTDVFFDTSTNVDYDDAFVVEGPESGLSYLECEDHGAVTCISQPYSQALGVLAGTVKCGPSAGNYDIFGWVPDCLNVKPDAETILSFDVPGCNAMVSRIQGMCSRIDANCESFEWARNYADDAARWSSYIGGVCARFRATTCVALASEVAFFSAVVYRQAMCDGVTDTSPECVGATRDAFADVVTGLTGNRFPYGSAYAAALWQGFVDLTQPGLPDGDGGGNGPTTCRPHSPFPEMGGSGCHP